MKPRSLAALLVVTQLAACEPAPSADSGSALESSSHAALLVMLDCRNHFTTAMQTLSRSAPALSAQQRLTILSQATSDRIRCEARIEPVLEEMRARARG